MFIDLSKYFECECVEKYLTYYELALFLKHSPVEDVKELYYFDSLLEYILDCNNLIEDYYDEDTEKDIIVYFTNDVHNAYEQTDTAIGYASLAADIKSNQ